MSTEDISPVYDPIIKHFQEKLKGKIQIPLTLTLWDGSVYRFGEGPGRFGFVAKNRKAWAEKLDRSREEITKRRGEQLYRMFRIYLWGSVYGFQTHGLGAYRVVLAKYDGGLTCPANRLLPYAKG